VSCAIGLLLCLQEFQKTPFVDEFNEASLDAAKWLVAFRQWSDEDCGGVVPENVSVRDGTVIFEAHGNRYTGPVRGIRRDRSDRADGRRVGGAVATRNRFASGRYEVRAKVAPAFGVCSAFWTFHYEERDKGEPINHEIDIELPGRPAKPFQDFSFEWALCNTFLTPERKVTSDHVRLPGRQDDGRFHTYRFDWHTGSPTQKKRVEFYVDDTLVRTIETNVPDRAGRFWVGVWCPPNFTGAADFDTARMVVDRVKIEPFGEPGDVFVPEPDDSGWAPGPGKRPAR
jgi:beta-glucanase (GH16 family)